MLDSEFILDLCHRVFTAHKVGKHLVYLPAGIGIECEDQTLIRFRMSNQLQTILQGVLQDPFMSLYRLAVFKRHQSDQSQTAKFGCFSNSKVCR